MAYVTATVTVWDADPTHRRREAAAGREGHPGPRLHRDGETVNAVDAWLGSLPGHVYANVRQPPISTLNLAHMIPLSAVWAGPERDEHFGRPPCFLARPKARPRSGFPFMSAMSATRSSSARPAPASPCCSR
jgi:type IV secretion system protein VirB4